MKDDIWLPRIYAIGKIALLSICGTLMALGYNSTITALFIAGSAALLGVDIKNRLSTK